MIDSKVLKVMNLALKFIGKLDEQQLDELINNESKFNVISKKKVNANHKTIRKSGNENFEEVIKVINNGVNRNETTEYIKGLKFNKDQLILLGEKLGIKISKSKKKDDIIAMIVEDTVGNKLKIEGLREGIMGEKHYLNDV